MGRPQRAFVTSHSVEVVGNLVLENAREDDGRHSGHYDFDNDGAVADRDAVALGRHGEEVHEKLVQVAR